MWADTVTSPVNIEQRRELGIKPGDTVRVWQKIEEKGKTRQQAFEGLVLSVKHGSEAGGMFTVRRVSSGVGVEKIFPLYSPAIDKIEIVKRAKVRRAKLYYIREKVAREIRKQMRHTMAMDVSTGSDIEEKEQVKREEEEKAKREEEAAKVEQEAEAAASEGTREVETPQEETKTDKVGSSDRTAKAD